MKKNNEKAEVYSSKLLDDLMSEITPQEQKRTDKRMKLAARIDKAIKLKGFKRKVDFANAMGKKSSEISRWLSGTHNISTDTLFDIEEVLGISLINIEEVQPVVQVIYNASVTASNIFTPEENIALYSESVPVSFKEGNC